MIDRAAVKFRALVAKLDGVDLAADNEATTRKRVIDEILEDVLGWDKHRDIHYEERTTEDGTTTYADYVLATANLGIVVEAKRYGKAFDLPSKRHACILGGAISNSDAGEATRQARDYARKLGHQFAVATNGRSWIVFPAARTDGVSFEKTQAHIFNGFSDIDSRFVLFWELLSRERVVEGSLEHALFGRPDTGLDRRLLSELKEPGFRVGRNVVYEHIEPAVTMSLADEALLHDVDGLRFCYVKTTERIKYDSRLRTHLLDIKPYVERKVARPRRKKQKEAYLDKIIETTDLARTPQLILLLGPVGAGKTTFLNYTRKISAADVIDGKAMWHVVDFKPATTADDPRKFIYDSLLTQIDRDTEFHLGKWKETLSKAYAPLIQSLKEGALALLAEADSKAFDKEVAEQVLKERQEVVPFVQTVLKYAAGLRPGFLVVDNVDQIDDVEYQERVFLEAQAAARTMGLNAIVSMRDATYLKHMTSPVFDAFQVDTIYIDPPQVVPVLSRRFSYAKTFLTNKKAEIVSESGKKFIVDDLSCFFDILTHSLLSEDTGFLVEVLSGNNVRRGLLLVRNFLASGHTSADNALFSYATQGSYRFRAHEFFKGAVFGQRQYYREEESLIPNIFDSHTGTRATQLLRFIILSVLKRLGTDENFSGLKVEDIEHDLYQIGVSRELVQQVLSDLVQTGLARTTTGHMLAKDSGVVVTRLGAYAVQELGCTLHYFEPCLIDANVFTDEEWEELVDLTRQVGTRRGPRSIPLRIRRAKAFLGYLQRLQNEWIVSCNRFSLGGAWAEDWIRSTLGPGLETECTRVVKSARRQIKRKRDQSKK